MIGVPKREWPVQPTWAQGRVIGHLDRASRDGAIQLEEVASGHSIFRECFENHNFDEGDPNLSPKGFGKAYFERCTFINCSFRGKLKVGFANCRFVDCNFIKGSPEEQIDEQNLRFSWCELNGRVYGREGAFSFVRLKSSQFSNCRLSRMQFSHTVEFEETRFHRTHGLPSCTGLEHDLLDADLRATPLGFADRIAPWERLRTFGRLPLFATSLSALVAIPVAFYIIALYNDQLLRLQERADQLLRLHDRAAQGGLARDTGLFARVEEILTRVEEMVKGLLAALHPIPVPSLSFWLLFSTVLLAIASTLFALLCPSRVREFSLDRWTDELRQSAIQYLPISWSRRWARIVAAPFYLVGGCGTAIILLIKVWNAGRFIVKNSAFPW
jgi:hypothetical protein